jgi:hypothetical protein
MKPTKESSFNFLSLLFCFISTQTYALDQHAGNWLIKKEANNTCVAQSQLQHGVVLETKKLTIPVKEMNQFQVYQVTLNDKVVLPTNKPNLVDTSCNCIRLRNMDALKADEVNIQIDAKSTKNTDITIKLQLKDIQQTMAALQANKCDKSPKNLVSLSMRQ